VGRLRLGGGGDGGGCGVWERSRRTSSRCSKRLEVLSPALDLVYLGWPGGGFVRRRGGLTAERGNRRTAVVGHGRSLVRGLGRTGRNSAVCQSGAGLGHAVGWQRQVRLWGAGSASAPLARAQSGFSARELAMRLRAVRAAPVGRVVVVLALPPTPHWWLAAATWVFTSGMVGAARGKLYVISFRMGRSAGSRRFMGGRH